MKAPLLKHGLRCDFRTYLNDLILSRKKAFAIPSDQLWLRERRRKKDIPERIDLLVFRKALKSTTLTLKPNP